MNREEFDRLDAMARQRYDEGDLEEAHSRLDSLAAALLAEAAEGLDISAHAYRWVNLDNYIIERWYA